jgi:hypothetical protein
MSIISVKNRSTRYMPKHTHNSYGIQNWLCKKGFILSKETKHKVDSEKYYELLKEFCLSIPEFDDNKIQKLGGYERFVQDRFPKFCHFVSKKFKEVGS